MVKHSKSYPTPSDWPLECHSVYGNDPRLTLSYGIGTFDYITGWSGNSGTIDPNSIRAYLGKCFKIIPKPQKVNSIVFFPDKK